MSKVFPNAPREPAPEPVFTIELQQRKFSFASIDAIQLWVNEQRDSQVWFYHNGDFGAEFNSLRETFRNGIQAAHQRLQEWQADKENPRLPQKLSNQLTSLFENERLVLADSPFARIAGEVAKKINKEASVGAYSTLIGVPCRISFDTLRGILEATFVQEGISPSSPKIVSNSLKALNDRARSDAQAHDEMWKAWSEQAKSDLSENRESSQAAVDAIERRSAGALELLITEGNTALDSIKKTEAAYKEQMRLQAPVDYWETKATTHRSAIWWSRLWVLLFAILGTGVLLASLISITIFASDHAVGKPAAEATAVYLKFAAVGAILTTVLFWAGRVLLRIYLSDRHLLTNSEERIAMIKTYLALSNDGKVEATERALVLGPIFRSAADGIVKDEGPDASLAGIIAKAIDIRGKA